MSLRQATDWGPSNNYYLSKMPMGAHMISRKLLIFLLAATAMSLGICQHWIPVSYDEQLISIQVEQEIGYIDKNIMNEPIEIQAMLLD